MIAVLGPNLDNCVQGMGGIRMAAGKFNPIMWIVAAVLGTAAAPFAKAETLNEALAAAYSTSPLIEHRRMLLRAADEDVALASATLSPVANFLSQANFSSPRPGNADSNWSGYLAFNLDLTVFDNGASRHAADAARETVLGMRAALLDVEQQVLLGAVEAYLETIRATQLVALRESNLQLIEQELRAARERFDVGEITRTNVSIAEARLAAAQGNLVAARGDLEIARETYRSAIGHYPDNPQLPAEPAQVTGTAEAASATAVKSHPLIEEATRNVNVTEANIRRARSAIGPTVTTGLTAGFRRPAGTQHWRQSARGHPSVPRRRVAFGNPSNGNQARRGPCATLASRFECEAAGWCRVGKSSGVHRPNRSKPSPDTGQRDSL